MNHSPCHLFDDFVGQGLTDPERAAFQAHLADCVDCRHALRGAERLNRLLTDAVECLAPVPAGLLPRIERRLNRARRRRRIAWAAGGIAAALLLGCLLLWRLHRPGIDSELPPTPLAKAPTPRPAETSPPEPPPAPAVRVTFTQPAKVIALPHPTDNPAVTIIWVYPAVQALPAPPSSTDPSPSRKE